MSENAECLLTSDGGSGGVSLSLWDWRVGTCLQQYKNGGVVKSRAVTVLRAGLLLSGEVGKPLVHVWPLNSEEPARGLRSVTAAPVFALASSHDGSYLAAGIGEQLHLWHAASGRLLALATSHFQPIVKLEWSADGSQLVSCGEDALVLVWSVARLLAGERQPLHTLSNHSLPVTDACLGPATADARLYTVSSDCTLAVHHLLSGQLLLSVVFDESLSAVVAAPWGPRVFAGTVSGAIHEVRLAEGAGARCRLQAGGGKEAAAGGRLDGHEKAVVALAVSGDGQVLASGGGDCRVLLWHVATRQKLRELAHAAPLTHLAFIRASSSLWEEEAQLRGAVPLAQLQRAAAPDLPAHTHTIHVQHSQDLRLPFQEHLAFTKVTSASQPAPNNSANSQIQKLRLVNSQLYHFCLDSILAKTNCDIDSLDDQKFKKKKRKYC